MTEQELIKKLNSLDFDDIKDSYLDHLKPEKISIEQWLDEWVFSDELTRYIELRFLDIDTEYEFKSDPRHWK